MPAAVAVPLIVGGIGAAATVAGAKMSSDAAGNALDFQKEQAEADWKNQEATRKANFDQWQAEQQRKGSIGQMFGLPAANIPAYVPTTDPRYTSGGSSSGSMGPAIAGIGASLTPAAIAAAKLRTTTPSTTPPTPAWGAPLPGSVASMPIVNPGAITMPPPLTDWASAMPGTNYGIGSY